MGMVNSDGRIRVHMRVTSVTTIYRAKDDIAGTMGELIKVIGITIRCMEKENSHGKMDVSTMETT